MSTPEGGFRDQLVDPEYWQPRIERLGQEPRGLSQIPRDDLSRPGVEVIELRLRAHDGVRLSALMARPSFYRRGCSIHLRICGQMDHCALDWGAVETGYSDVVFAYPEERHIEDRVLDVLRVAEAACSLEDVERSCVELYSGHQHPPQEFVIADLLRERGLA